MTAKRGDIEVRLASYRRLIYSLALKYASWRCPIEDLLQVGRVAAWRALSTHIPDRSTELAWVYRRVGLDMRHYIRDYGNIIRVPQRAAHVPKYAEQIEADRERAYYQLDIDSVNIKGQKLQEIIADEKTEGWEALSDARIDVEYLLSQLTGQSRKIAEMVILRGYSFDQVSAVLGSTVPNVRGGYFYARGRLRTFYEQRHVVDKGKNLR